MVRTADAIDRPCDDPEGAVEDHALHARMEVLVEFHFYFHSGRPRMFLDLRRLPIRGTPMPCIAARFLTNGLKKANQTNPPMKASVVRVFLVSFFISISSFSPRAASNKPKLIERSVAASPHDHEIQEPDAHQDGDLFEALRQLHVLRGGRRLAGRMVMHDYH